VKNPTMLARIVRILTFRADGDDYDSLTWHYLAAGLVATWVVGVGRYWDNPRISFFEHAGLGSVVYVFVLSVLLWILGLALRPKRWRYFNLLVFVTLTAPPGLIYAIPVERFMSIEGARTANLWFLAIVAIWRLALYAHFLAIYAELRTGPRLVQLLLPMCLIIAILTALNLERAVFDVMGGVARETTSADSAYGVLVMLTLISVYLFPALVVAYGFFTFKGWREAKGRD